MWLTDVCVFFLKISFRQHSISIGQPNKNQPGQKKPTPEAAKDGSYQC